MRTFEKYRLIVAVAIRVVYLSGAALVRSSCFRRLVIFIVAAASVLAATTASAAISVTSATLIPNVSAREQSDVNAYILSASAVIELNPTIENGLASGVPLYFNAELKISRSTRWWIDQTVHSQSSRYSLVYYELTRHYRVTSIEQLESRNFRSLLDALDYIGTLRNVPVRLASALSDDQSYIASLNLTLDEKSLPLALQPFVFVGSAWRLHSEDYSWQIN